MEEEDELEDFKFFLINIMAVMALLFIFIAAFILLIIICRKQRKRHYSTSNWNRFYNHSGEGKIYPNIQAEELTDTLNDIGINSLENMINDNQWNNVSHLIPNCLEILKYCHKLTEKLANLTVNRIITKQSAERLINSSKRVPTRVDDVVRSLYPKLDLKLLDARTTSLVLSVGQLALLTQNICGNNNNKWIEKELEELDNLLLILRKSIQELEDNSNRKEFINRNLQLL